MRRLVAAGPLAWAVMVFGLAAAVLMIATEFSTIQSIKIGASTCGAADEQVRDVCETSGGDAHNWALFVLGLFAALLTFGAAVGRSKPAAFALAAVGVIVLLVALLLDRPDLDETRGLETNFADVEAVTGGGYQLEIIAGVLALVAAGLALLRERRASASDEKARRSRRRRSEEAAADSAA